MRITETAKHEAEIQRIREMIADGILDTSPDPCFDRIVQMVAETCDAPVALVNLVGHHWQWTMASAGIELDRMPRRISFCAHAVRDPSNLLVVPDAARDERFADNPLVTEGPRLRFYAGAPLVTTAGEALGTLCVVDRVPRELTQQQKAALRALARVVVRFIERRRDALRTSAKRFGAVEVAVGHEAFAAPMLAA